MTHDTSSRSSALFCGLLWFGLLTMRVESRWALTAFELALFTLAAAQLVQRRFAIRPHPIALLLAAAALWGVLQVALGISVDPQRTLEASLGWTVNCAAFSLALDRKSTRLNSSHVEISYAVFCLKK